MSASLQQVVAVISGPSGISLVKVVSIGSEQWGWSGGRRCAGVGAECRRSANGSSGSRRQVAGLVVVAVVVVVVEVVVAGSSGVIAVVVVAVVVSWWSLVVVVRVVGRSRSKQSNEWW